MLMLVEDQRTRSWDVVDQHGLMPLGTVYPSFGTLMFLPQGGITWSAEMLEMISNSMQALKQEIGMVEGENK